MFGKNKDSRNEVGLNFFSLGCFSVSFFFVSICVELMFFVLLGVLCIWRCVIVLRGICLTWIDVIVLWGMCLTLFMGENETGFCVAVAGIGWCIHVFFLSSKQCGKKKRKKGGGCVFFHFVATRKRDVFF